MFIIWVFPGTTVEFHQTSLESELEEGVSPGPSATEWDQVACGRFYDMKSFQWQNKRTLRMPTALRWPEVQLVIQFVAARGCVLPLFFMFSKNQSPQTNICGSLINLFCGRVSAKIIAFVNICLPIWKAIDWFFPQTLIMISLSCFFLILFANFRHNLRYLGTSYQGFISSMALILL